MPMGLVLFPLLCIPLVQVFMTWPGVDSWALQPGWACYTRHISSFMGSRMTHPTPSAWVINARFCTCKRVLVWHALCTMHVVLYPSAVQLRDIWHWDFGYTAYTVTWNTCCIKFVVLSDLKRNVIEYFKGTWI